MALAQEAIHLTGGIFSGNLYEDNVFSTTVDSQFRSSVTLELLYEFELWTVLSNVSPDLQRVTQAQSPFLAFQDHIVGEKLDFKAI